ncbi:CRISPR-associated endonuclease Cas1 [Methanogenium cariaci]|uniref:CRISPR-associated endonuclease Cas1 n=1 Tax=Methanogenium cariaci TaxID=2197 RepID=UPI00155D9213|nr:CRISPR-associated endonuclease Cas1 [Methanogenium cariaci]
MTSEHSWHVVAGFGAHIKSTGTTLSILYKGEQKEFPLPSVQHLLLVGGHNIHTSAVTRLLRQGSSVSFFDADGTPVACSTPSAVMWERISGKPSGPACPIPLPGKLHRSP